MSKTLTATDYWNAAVDIDSKVHEYMCHALAFEKTNGSSRFNKVNYEKENSFKQILKSHGVSSLGGLTHLYQIDGSDPNSAGNPNLVSFRQPGKGEHLDEMRDVRVMFLLMLHAQKTYRKSRAK